MVLLFRCHHHHQPSRTEQTGNMPSKGSIGALIFGGFAFFGILGTLWFYFSRKKTITFQPTVKPVQAEKVSDEVGNAGAEVDGVVEDVESEDEEGEEEDDRAEESGQGGKLDAEEEAEKARQAEYKTKFEDAIRIGEKFLAGQRYPKAAEEYSKAIEIADKLSPPPPPKRLSSLYNQRSACYEKSGQMEQALLDVNVLLMLDAVHIKGRFRRARIHEALVWIFTTTLREIEYSTCTLVLVFQLFLVTILLSVDVDVVLCCVASE